MYNAGIIVTKNIITDLSAGCELNKEIVIMTKITDINTQRNCNYDQNN